jgi:hypothetical protein
MTASKGNVSAVGFAGTYQSIKEEMEGRARFTPSEEQWVLLTHAIISGLSGLPGARKSPDLDSSKQGSSFFKDSQLKMLSKDGTTLVITKRDRYGSECETTCQWPLNGAQITITKGGYGEGTTITYQSASENSDVKRAFELLSSCRKIYERAVTQAALDGDQSKATLEAVSAARVKLEGIQGKHGSEFVNKCWNVVQTSDQIAIYRNVAKIFITAAAAIVMGLAAAGIVSSGALLLIAAGAAVCTFLGVSVFFGALAGMGKISLKTAITHTLLLTLIASISYFTAIVFQASWVLTALYAVSVIVQGALFFGPQGLGAFGKGYYDKYQIAREAGDEKHKVTAALGVTSGVMSALEGLAWTLLGVLMLATSCPWMKDLLEIVLHNSGLAAQVLEMGGDMIKYTNWILYFGIFNVGYVFGIISACNDWRIQSNFYKQLTKEVDLSAQKFSEFECFKCLHLIRDKMTGKKTAALEGGKLTKKQLRLSKLVDGEVYELLTIENIDNLLNGLNAKDSDQKEAARATSELLIREVIAANQKNQKTAQLQLAIAITGLIIGTALSVGGEFATSAAAHAVNIADCSLWALINFGFFAVDSEMIKSKTAQERQGLEELIRRLRVSKPEWRDGVKGDMQLLQSILSGGVASSPVAQSALNRKPGLPHSAGDPLVGSGSIGEEASDGPPIPSASESSP